MKDILDGIKNLTSQQWISILTALAFYGAYKSNEKRIEQLDKRIDFMNEQLAKEREASKHMFLLYKECIEQKNKQL